MIHQKIKIFSFALVAVMALGAYVAGAYFRGGYDFLWAGSKKNPVNEEWKEKLTDEQYAILIGHGTEAPFSSPLDAENRPGTYYAADTRQPVFRSEDKFDSGTGWPSFTRPISEDAVKTEVDTILGFERTEVLTTAGGHLGHVFTDGPAPTGLRYCMNGDAMYFVPDELDEE